MWDYWGLVLRYVIAVIYSSCLPKTTCEERIQVKAKKVHTLKIDEVKLCGYFSLAIDSPSDLSHIDNLSVVLN